MRPAFSPTPSTVAAAAAVLAAVVCPRQAGAERPPRPAAPRVIHAPTAHLRAPGEVYASAGSTHRGDPFAAVSLGVAGLAELDLQLAGTIAACVSCSGGDRHADPIAVPSAAFKIGIGEGRWTRWQPAVALAFRKSLGERTVDLDAGRQHVAAATLALIASKRLAPVDLHAGVQLWDARVRDDDTTRFLHDLRPRDRLRPFAGIGWTPSIYPRTTLLADLSFAPVIEPDGAHLRWLAGWGARYQALSWGSIELAVRHRDGDALGDTDVIVRVNLAGP